MGKDSAISFQSGIILTIFIIIQNCCYGDEILGCGGFIKSPTDIDFSQIGVKLYTKSGSLKDHTECAPNTGYYFLPLYDKGEYILKLDPPIGWSFEPTEVVLNVDDTYSDPCSQGKDIFFTFKGFGITGNVVTVSTQPGNKWSPGPKDVTISLLDKSNKTLLDKTVTNQGGTFSFTPIQPGQYVLVASHPVWVMEKHSTQVLVQAGNTLVKDGDLSVFGFDVSGRVTTTDGDPVGKAILLLIGDGKVRNCNIIPNIPKSVTGDRTPLCGVISDNTGRFSFPALTSGNYTVIPYYAQAKTKFDFRPSEISFSVGLDSLILPQTFKVTGFTISGKVMASIDPSIPLVGAKVFLSKKEIGVSDSKGVYRSDNVKSKQYVLHAEADDVLFDEVSVKVNPNNPELPTIVPSAFKIMGKVLSSTKISLVGRKVLMRNLNTDQLKEISVDSGNGQWSVYVSPGKYQLSVGVTDDEKTKGLQFFPTQRTVEVSHEPVGKIDFLQLKATLQGSVVCLQDKDSTGECKQTQVTLKMVDSTGESKSVAAKDGEYQFEDVLPGQYQVLIDTDNFCWESSSHQVTVASENPPKLPPFKQTGFSVTFVSSHETFVNFTSPDKPSKKQTLKLAKGSTRHCVLESGKYEFQPYGLHKYPKQNYPWNTSDRTPIILSSNEHLHKGHILSSIGVEGVKVRVEGESGGQKPIIIGPLEYKVENGSYSYEFAFYAVTGESYLIHPLSDTLLFEPPSLKVIGSEDYIDSAASFIGVQGKIFSGSVSPPLEGVSVKIFGRDKETPSHTVVTQQSGTFRVGPLDGRTSYSITAEKEGYILSRDPNTKEIVFYARKLAEINVEVLDTDGGASLQGVLISLSGSNGINSYRKNSITGQNGKLTFHSLSPGEYYLRPTMKEYRFDPASRMIRVDEGATVTVGLVGRRVAFSAYGIVTCLNGQPEPNLLVEAKGQGDCADLQEEALTKEDGTWRIRGLEPRCLYIIRLKLNEQESNIRAIPGSIAVVASQDVHNLKLIALQPISRSDLSVRVIANQPDYYRSLKVKLCRENAPDSPLHVAKIDGQNLNKISNSGFLLHFPPLQADGKRYLVQLESSLSKILHNYKIEPVYFETNTSFKYLELTFEAERRHDHADTIQMSFIPLPLIILVTLAFFNRDGISVWLNGQLESWSKRAQSNVKSSQSNLAVIVPNDPRADDIIVEQIESINRKIKKVKPRKA